MTDGMSSARRAPSYPRRTSTVFTRFKADTAAGPIVEFAVVVPVLLLLLFGIIDFARAFFQRNNLVAAVREGARFAATQDLPCDAATQTAVRNRVLAYFSSVGDAAPSTINVTTAGTCPRGVETITVSITSYPFTAITPVFRLLGGNGIRLNASAVYRWEQSP